MKEALLKDIVKVSKTEGTPTLQIAALEELALGASHTDPTQCCLHAWQIPTQSRNLEVYLAVGERGSGGLIPRLANLENACFGVVQSGSLQSRIQGLQQLLCGT